MEIEPPQVIGHDFGGQNAQRELVAAAQALGHCGTDLAFGQAQFVGQFLGCGIEIGEVVAPALDLAAREQRRILRFAVERVSGTIIKPRKRDCGLRRGVEPFDHLGAIDPQVVEQRIGQAAAQAIDPAGLLMTAQRAWIEVELLGHRQQQPCGKRTLVALDQVEVAGGDAQRGGHRRLGQPFAATDAAQARSGEHRLLNHTCNFPYNTTIRLTQFTAIAHQIL